MTAAPPPPPVGGPSPVIRLLAEVEELSQADRLLARIWGGEGESMISAHLLKALAHSGNYVAGVWNGTELIGASVGFVWGSVRPAALHSHVTGLDPAWQGKGLGLALKQHQAEWARGVGLRTITWTYDPLVRRNAWMNLVKLGALGESYYPNFYGDLRDGINDGQLTDRCLVVWDVTRPVAPAGYRADDVADRRPVPPDGRILLEEVDGGPRVSERAAHSLDLVPLYCQVPADVVALRRADPGTAREWRLALRDTMGAAMQEGYVATSMTGDGFYVLERRPR